MALTAGTSVAIGGWTYYAYHNISFMTQLKLLAGALTLAVTTESIACLVKICRKYKKTNTEEYKTKMNERQKTKNQIFFDTTKECDERLKKDPSGQSFKMFCTQAKIAHQATQACKKAHEEGTINQYLSQLNSEEWQRYNTNSYIFKE